MIPRSSTTILVTGVLAVIFGLVALFWPVHTAMAVVMIVGAFLVVAGIAEAVFAARSGRGVRGWGLWSGILTALVGIVALFAPAAGVTAVVWIVGVWLIVRGVLSLMAATSTPGPGRGLGVLVGILWILLALILLLNPVAGAGALSILLGVLALFSGFAMIAAGFLFRRVGNGLRRAEAQFRQQYGTVDGGTRRTRSPLDTGDVIEGETK